MKNIVNTQNKLEIKETINGDATLSSQKTNIYRINNSSNYEVRLHFFKYGNYVDVNIRAQSSVALNKGRYNLPLYSGNALPTPLVPDGLDEVIVSTPYACLNNCASSGDGNANDGYQYAIVYKKSTNTWYWEQLANWSPPSSGTNYMGGHFSYIAK